MDSSVSFKDVYDRHARMVYNLCLNYVQNAEEAQELTQDVFVKVHEGFGNFRGDAALRTWIYRIAINTSLDHLKARKRKKRSLFGLFGATDQQAANVAASAFEHPGVLLEDREATARIFERIDALPDAQRTALLMKSMEGLSQNEIAEVMGISAKAVESLLSRARHQLKKALGRTKDEPKMIVKGPNT